MSNGIIEANTPKLKNKPAIKGATSKRTGLIIHGSNLLNLISGNIKSFTPISRLLIVQKP
jgi:hypothetical protein